MASLTNAAAYVVAFGLQTLLVFAGNSRFFGLLKEGSGWRTNVEMSVPLRVDTYATPCRSRAVRTGGTGQLALGGARLYVRRTRTRLRRTLAPQVLYTSFVTPANWAFAIWGLIYTWELVSH